METNKNDIMKATKTLKLGSRLDNSKGHLITEKEYLCTIIKPLKYGFYLVQIGNKKFTTDYTSFK